MWPFLSVKKQLLGESEHELMSCITVLQLADSTPKLRGNLGRLAYGGVEEPMNAYLGSALNSIL